MKYNIKYLILFLIILSFAGFKVSGEDDWGFFGHRRINRLAVFTLPEEMMPLFKSSLDFLTEHAVDPDKRRYAFRLEAPRHYLDMDAYKDKCLPHNFAEAFSAYSHLEFINNKNDTIRINVTDTSWCNDSKSAVMTDGRSSWEVSKRDVRYIYNFFVLPSYYDDNYNIPIDSLSRLYTPLKGKMRSVRLVDHFTEHGIVPYVIEQQYNKLVKAFIAKDKDRIINISADLGHYVADANVPLHACSNYNGQKSDQYGIHAFWESRIPELFADEQYDYFVGKAKYIKNINEFAWQTIRESGRLADTVLLIEAELRKIYPKDQQMCFDQRSGQAVWLQCRDFAAAYSDKMQGMVENRMRNAILGVGSIWYTAWVESGKPDLNFLKDQPVFWIQDSSVLKYDEYIKSGKKGQGRDHE